MKTPLTSKRKNVAVILGSKKLPLPSRSKDWYYERLTAYCRENCEVYAFNMHERDIDDDGEIKFLHIHMAMIMKSKDKRLSVIMNALAKVCEIDSQSIQIDEMTSLVGSTQYLIHKRNPEKTQYLMSEIQTNMSDDELNTIMESDEDTMSVTYLISVCKECRCNRIEIMKKIGLNFYHHYRLVIKDICDTL